MNRRDRYTYLLLKEHRRNCWVSLPRSPREWEYRTSSPDPEDIADVYDMRLQVAEVLELLDAEVRQVAALTRAAYREGASGRRWEDSTSKRKLDLVMGDVPPGQPDPEPKDPNAWLEWRDALALVLLLPLCRMWRGWRQRAGTFRRCQTDGGGVKR